MKKISILILAILLTQSCTKEILKEVEVPGDPVVFIQTETIETVRYEDGGSVSAESTIVPIRPHQTVVVFTLTVNGNLYRLEDFSLDINSSLSQLSDIFTSIELRERTNRVIFDNRRFSDLTDDDDYLIGDPANGNYYFNAEDHIFEIVVSTGGFTGNHQITIDDVELELQKYIDDTEFEINYRSSQEFVIFLEE